MRPVDPNLTALRSDLERLGYVVVPHGDHLCVRLSLFASVRVHRHEGRFDLRPQFGPFSRTGGLLATTGVATAALSASALTVGLAPLTAIVAFLGVVGLAHDACRYVITEGALTRLQLLAAGALPAREPLRSTTPRDALAAAEGAALQPGMPVIQQRPSPSEPPQALRPPSRKTLP